MKQPVQKGRVKTEEEQVQANGCINSSTSDNYSLLLLLLLLISVLMPRPQSVTRERRKSKSLLLRRIVDHQKHRLLRGSQSHFGSRPGYNAN